MLRRSNVPLGLVGGMIMAALTSLAAVVVYVVRGAEAFEAFGVSLASTIGLYFAGGIVGGVAVGLLLPLTTWRIGAVFVGIVVAVPVYLGAGLLMGESGIVSGIVAAVFVGGLVGYGLWSPPQESDGQRA